jgi:hypothetical protein
MAKQVQRGWIVSGTMRAKATFFVSAKNADEAIRKVNDGTFDNVDAGEMFDWDGESAELNE